MASLADKAFQSRNGYRNTAIAEGPIGQNTTAIMMDKKDARADDTSVCVCVCVQKNPLCCGARAAAASLRLFVGLIASALFRPQSSRVLGRLSVYLSACVSALR